MKRASQLFYGKNPADANVHRKLIDGDGTTPAGVGYIFISMPAGFYRDVDRQRGKALS